MSAFMVADKTINRIVTALEFDTDTWHQQALVALGYSARDGDEERQRLGEALKDLNRSAIVARYGPSDELPGTIAEGPYKFERELSGHKCQVLKSLRCLIYQCTEGEAPETELYKALQDLSHSWALSIVDGLSAYENARWDG